tara:strand:- start:181226 stop:181828 length:603 start_codon:yes stop_codon:yes gene_type:complete
MKIRRKHALRAFMLIGSVLAAGVAQSAAAHEFTAAIVGSGPGADALVAEAARGFIVATDERDGHASETSDGHLGGLDVQIRVLPAAAGEAVDALVGMPRDPADIAIFLGQELPGNDGIGTVLGPDTIIFRAGSLPSRQNREASEFGDRFKVLFGRSPTETAEQGYNAARRVDMAIRRHSGLAPRAAIESALAETATGIDW